MFSEADVLKMGEVQVNVSRLYDAATDNKTTIANGLLDPRMVSYLSPYRFILFETRLSFYAILHLIIKLPNALIRQTTTTSFTKHSLWFVVTSVWLFDFVLATSELFGLFRI